MAILIGNPWYFRFSRSFCKQQMFRISMQQASTKGMIHYLEHSSNCAIIYIYYISWILYIYILCTYIQKYPYMFSLPPKSNVYSVYPPILYLALTPIQRLASTVEAFWRLHQLEDVARRFFNGKIERVGQWWWFCWRELRFDSVIGVWHDWYFHIGFLGMMTLTSPARDNAVGWILSEWPWVKLMKNSMWVMQPGVRTNPMPSPLANWILLASQSHPLGF